MLDRALFQSEGSLIDILYFDLWLSYLGNVKLLFEKCVRYLWEGWTSLFVTVLDASLKVFIRCMNTGLFQCLLFSTCKDGTNGTDALECMSLSSLHIRRIASLCFNGVLCKYFLWILPMRWCDRHVVFQSQFFDWTQSFLWIGTQCF